MAWTFTSHCVIQPVELTAPHTVYAHLFQPLTPGASPWKAARSWARHGFSPSRRQPHLIWPALNKRWCNASVPPPNPLPGRNASDVSSRRRKINVRTCGTAQPRRQDPFQERAAFWVEFEKTRDRVQPHHRCLVWSYYCAFLGFSFLYLLMITNALLSHGNAAGIHNLCFHATQTLRRWVPEDIYWSAAFQISKLLVKEHHKKSTTYQYQKPTAISWIIYSSVVNKRSRMQKSLSRYAAKTQFRDCDSETSTPL